MQTEQTLDLDAGDDGPVYNNKLIGIGHRRRVTNAARRSARDAILVVIQIKAFVRPVLQTGLQRPRGIVCTNRHGLHARSSKPLQQIGNQGNVRDRQQHARAE